jgi:hypothetical protein
MHRVLPGCTYGSIRKVQGALAAFGKIQGRGQGRRASNYRRYGWIAVDRLVWESCQKPSVSQAQHSEPDCDQRIFDVLSVTKPDKTALTITAQTSAALL